MLQKRPVENQKTESFTGFSQLYHQKTFFQTFYHQTIQTKQEHVRLSNVQCLDFSGKTALAVGIRDSSTVG